VGNRSYVGLEFAKESARAGRRLDAGPRPMVSNFSRGTISALNEG